MNVRLTLAQELVFMAFAVGVVLTISLAAAGSRAARWAAVALGLAAALGLAYVLWQVAASARDLGSVVFFFVMFLVVALGATLVEMIRWGWVGVLLACLGPGEPLRLRGRLGVVGVCWAAICVAATAVYAWRLMPSNARPPNARLVKSARYGDFLSLRMFDGQAFCFERYQCADASAPKAGLLDQLEAQLAPGGWKRWSRYEGRQALIPLLLVYSMGAAPSPPSRGEVLTLLRGQGGPGYLDVESMASDEGLGRLVMSNEVLGTLSFRVYDKSDGRFVDVVRATRRPRGIFDD